GVLTDCVAWSLGLPSSAVEYSWRVLRENGIVTKGRRGWGAAHVTSQDAANLLVAAAAAVPGRDVIDTWRDYALLPAQQADVQREGNLYRTRCDPAELSPGIWVLEPLDIPVI